MADRPHTQDDLDESYVAGERDTEQRLLPFTGVGRVRFATDVDPLVAAQAYEQDMTQELFTLAESLLCARRVERIAVDEHALAHHAAHEMRRGRETIDAANALVRRYRYLRARIRADAQLRDTLARMTRLIAARDHLEHTTIPEHEQQLHAVRAWLDEQITIAAEYAAARTGRRRSNDLPYQVVRYADAHAFFTEDPRRTSQPGSDECGGEWYGQRWTLETPGSELDVITWAVYWLQHGELYARALPRRAGLRDHGVLLLGRLPFPARYSDENAWLWQLKENVMRERNSLAALAGAIVERQHTLSHQPTP
jgi:hypothetical protein